jgi:hypothetical protein
MVQLRPHRMRTGAFTDPNAPLLHLTGDAVNVSLLGYGATIRMRRLDYMNTSAGYPAGEGRHTQEFYPREQ